MLRAVASFHFESQTLELFATARRDVFKLFRTSSTAATTQTVLTSSGSQSDGARCEGGPQGPGPRSGGPQGEGPRGGPPPPRRPRHAWTAAAAAVALTASIGGVYFYRKLNDDEKKAPVKSEEAGSAACVSEGEAQPPPEPAEAGGLPAAVEYLLAGGGTASFAAMRALRSARPDAAILIVSEENALPYMRPPFSKEVWREEGVGRASLSSLSFRQWDGRRRGVLYEPPAFYSRPDRLQGGGVAVATGWKVERLDVQEHRAYLVSSTGERAEVQYGSVLVATGLVGKRRAALAGAGAAGAGAGAGGRVVWLRRAGDAARLAALLDTPAPNVLVLGGGTIATELAAALAMRLAGSGGCVRQVYREPAPLWRELPPYLARDAARRLRALGVRTLAAHVLRAAPAPHGLRLHLHSGDTVEAHAVVDPAGEPERALAAASGLETDPRLGGILVNAELQARSGVFAAGDAASYHDVALGRRREERHDHAVATGRRAGDNMAGAALPMDHQSMMWSDLGPDLGYEAVGIIDSRLQTVGVFAEDAVTDAGAEEPASAESLAEGTSQGGAEGAALPRVAAAEVADPARPAEGTDPARPAEGTDPARPAEVADPSSLRYDRGVVFYLRDGRVVGVLLWNLFNRIHIARQVLAQGEFEDLFEVAKLFTLHEDE